jgi:hypothetical protein
VPGRQDIILFSGAPNLNCGVVSTLCLKTARLYDGTRLTNLFSRQEKFKAIRRALGSSTWPTPESIGTVCYAFCFTVQPLSLQALSTTST